MIKNPVLYPLNTVYFYNTAVYFEKNNIRVYVGNKYTEFLVIIQYKKASTVINLQIDA